MNAARLQHIDPDGIEFQLAPPQIEMQLARKRGRVLIQHLRQRAKLRIALRQVIQRSIGGVASVPVLPTPLPPSDVILRDHAAAFQQRRIVHPRQRGAVELGDEQRLDLHARSFRGAQAQRANAFAR